MMLLDDLYFSHHDELFGKPDRIIDNDEWIEKFGEFIRQEIKGYVQSEHGQLGHNEHFQVVVDRKMSVFERKVKILPGNDRDEIFSDEDVIDRMYTDDRGGDGMF